MLKRDLFMEANLVYTGISNWKYIITDLTNSE